MTSSPMDPIGPRLTTSLYGHVVAATLLHCLVIVTALASRSMALWAAGLLLMSALALAAHAAHVRRTATPTGAHR